MPTPILLMVSSSKSKSVVRALNSSVEASLVAARPVVVEALADRLRVVDSSHEAVAVPSEVDVELLKRPEHDRHIFSPISSFHHFIISSFLPFSLFPCESVTVG